MFSTYARAGIAVLVGFIFLASPLIGFSALASPLLQATPTSVTRTPTAQSTQVAKPTLGALLSSGGISPNADKYYEVKSGDTLWTIAANVYGNGSLYTLIQQANGLPEKTVLRVGSKLLIPLTDAPTPTLVPSSQPTESIKPTATLSPQSSATNTSVLTISMESPSADSEIEVPATTNKSNGHESSSLVRYIQLSAYLLSIACFMGSFCCAYLSFEVYRRNQLYIRRRHIGNRVLTGL